MNHRGHGAHRGEAKRPAGAPFRLVNRKSEIVNRSRRRALEKAGLPRAAAFFLLLLLVLLPGRVRSQPRIELDADTWNFGDLPRDSVADYRLIIRNTGDRPLSVEHVRSSCACLLILFEPTDLGAGEEMRVPLRYAPDKRKGETAKTVFIDSSDPTSPRVRFEVRGNILEARAGEVHADPNPCYLETAPGQAVEQEIVLGNIGLGALSISSVRGVGCDVEEPGVQSLEPSQTVPFRIRVVPDERWGFNYWVLVESDDPIEPLLIVPIHPVLENEPSLEMTLAGMGSSARDTVRAVLFASLDCPHCLALTAHFFPRVRDFFEGRFLLEIAYVDREDNYAWLVETERRMGSTGNDIPVLVVGSEILGGDTKIIRDLPQAIETAFARHGCDLPEKPAALDVPPVSARGDTLYLAYFRKPGCKECDRAIFLLNRLAKRFAPVLVRTFDITTPEAQELNEALSCAYGVPESRRLIAPSLFGGGRYLVGHDLDDASAEVMLGALGSGSNAPPWIEAESLREEARRSIISRFQSLGPLTVVLGGLVDGVNPCAFATIIFFVSYLAFVGRAGREILWIGAAFTMAVFLTYVLVGLGAMTFLQSLSVFRLVSNIVYAATAVLAVGLGVYSTIDFVKLRRGKTREVTLQLPGFLKKRIHKTIREQTRTRRFVLAAFVTGAIVSLLELACTGQVYLPTICFVTGIPSLRAHALAYLLLYNVMFVVPLVAVFLVSYYGATSAQMGRFFQSHAAMVKLCTAVFFFALAAILLSVLL